METQIDIRDDFDLEKIASCGQCFRVRRFEDGTYRFLTGSHILYIRRGEDNRYVVSCSPGEWQEIWETYFDLGRDYRSLRERAAGKHDFVHRAMEYGCGLRVLRQDPWEMLVTFIISQRKNIPAISKSVEALAQKYGRLISTARENVSLFPTPEELYPVSEEELSGCQLGYRSAYVRDAAEKVFSGELDLKEMARYEDEALFQGLMKIHGVGKKVANCVALFGYGRSSRVPMDVWIARVIEEECGGENPFPAFGEDAGIIQQYAFYYEKNCRTETEKI